MNFQFSQVSREFHLIEEITKTILITKEEEAQKIYEELRVKGLTKELMRKMGPYCVNVYETDFNKMNAAGMLRGISEELKEDYFVLNDTERYSEEMGLELDVDYGEAVIF